MLHTLDMQKKLGSLLLVLVFFTNTVGFAPKAQAEGFQLPAPGQIVHLSPSIKSPILKAIKVHPNNPFKFDFIMDVGAVTNRPNTRAINNRPYNEEAVRLIKYFLASLTIPEKNLWVNLSPYEKKRIVPDLFGKTEMGRDLLAEDYMLKQITSSLIYPEDAVGKKFWKRIYEETTRRFGTTDIPVNTFNKVWIVPEKAVVYENAKAGTAYVVESRLKVMLEGDYLALQKNHVILREGPQNDINALGSKIVREIVIPELNREVNEGDNFAQLRQVYNSLILATWYKKKIKDSILGQVYEDKNKIKGTEYQKSIVDINGRMISAPTKNDVELIYQRYLQAFKKGAYNLVKEEQDPITQQMVPRKYFSGGVGFTSVAAGNILDVEQANPSQDMIGHDHAMAVEVELNRISGDRAQNSVEERLGYLTTLKLSLENTPEKLPMIINLGDLHGDERDLEKAYSTALNSVQDKKHITIIVHGDTFDRGKRNKFMWYSMQRLKNLTERNPNIKVIFLLGNHEQMFLKAVLSREREAIKKWLQSGGSDALEQLDNGSPKREFYEGKQYLDLQIEYMMDLKNPLHTLNNMANFILKNFSFVYLDEWGYLHKHTGVPMDDHGKSHYTLEQLYEIEDLWDDVRHLNDKGKALKFLSDYHEILWGDQLFDVLAQFYEGPNLKAEKFASYLASISPKVTGVVLGHESHGMHEIEEIGKKKEKMLNVGGYYFGIDMNSMADHQIGGSLIMDPNQGIYYQPIKGGAESFYTREEFIGHLTQNIGYLENMIQKNVVEDDMLKGTLMALMANTPLGEKIGEHDLKCLFYSDSALDFAGFRIEIKPKDEFPFTVEFNMNVKTGRIVSFGIFQRENAPRFLKAFNKQLFALILIGFMDYLKGVDFKKFESGRVPSVKGAEFFWDIFNAWRKDDRTLQEQLKLSEEGLKQRLDAIRQSIFLSSEKISFPLNLWDWHKVRAAISQPARAASEEASDPAMMPNPTGGIDLNSSLMDLSIKNNNGEIHFNFNPSMVYHFQNSPGFSPIIINIQPVTDIKAFLGCN